MALGVLVHMCIEPDAGIRLRTNYVTLCTAVQPTASIMTVWSICELETPVTHWKDTSISMFQWTRPGVLLWPQGTLNIGCAGSVSSSDSSV